MARGEPDAEAGHRRQDDGSDANVEGPDKVGVVARERAADDAGGVEDGDELIGELLGEALVHGVGGGVAHGDEEGKLEEEEPNGEEQERSLSEDAKVGMGRGVLGRRESGTNKSDADEAATERDEGDGAHCPAEANPFEELRLHDGVDDSPEAAGRRGHARGQSSPGLEPMADGGDAGREQE